MDANCCICGNILENQNSVDHLCEECEVKYGYYDDYEYLVVEPMRKRKRYDDER